MNSQDQAIEEELAMHEALEKLFRQLVPESHVADYTAHLGDMYGSMKHLRNAISALAQVDPRDREALLDRLVAINTQLYHHLTAHIEGLRHLLGDLIDSLSDEVEDANGVE